jgi:hypothetical protein
MTGRELSWVVTSKKRLALIFAEVLDFDPKSLNSMEEGKLQESEKFWLSWFIIMLLDRSDHQIIWLPDGNEISDREKHLIQSPKLILAFVWNSHGFQLVDAIPCQKERYSRPSTISERFHRDPYSACGER